LLKVYLDSSAIVKRYVTEPGSFAMDHVYDKCEVGEACIATSIWNIGEVLGVLDERHRRGWLSEGEFTKALESFAGETVRLMRLRVLEIIPIFAPILVESWSLILSEHIYEADALQIRTCIYRDSDIFISGDKDLIGIALKAGLKALDVQDEEKIKELT